MMNIKTFKKFCLKAGTKKADEIHDYFIKLEETLQEIINDESNELRLQLEEKDTIITEKDTIITKKESEIGKINNQKMKEIEAIIISNFPLNTDQRMNHSSSLVIQIISDKEYSTIAKHIKTSL